MIRDYVQSDYVVLCDWWDQHKFPRPPEGILPSTGFVCNEVVAGFLYLTNSSVAWLEWVVGDPKSDAQLRRSSLDELINHVIDRAKVCDCKVLFMSTNHPAMEARLVQMGFVLGDEKTSHYTKVIK